MTAAETTYTLNGVAALDFAGVALPGGRGEEGKGEEEGSRDTSEHGEVVDVVNGCGSLNWSFR